VTTAQRQRVRFWTWECGYSVVDGPSEPTLDGTVRVAIKHPKSAEPLRYLLSADGSSVLERASNQDSRPHSEETPSP
jgi:hypothetical protein